LEKWVEECNDGNRYKVIDIETGFEEYRIKRREG